MRILLSFIGVLLLSACIGSEPSAPAQHSQLVHGVAAENLTSYIVLVERQRTSAVRTIDVVVRNPSRKPIRAIRAWMRFDPRLTSVKNLEITDSRFSLVAPGENMVDSADGTIKLGVASSQDVRDVEILFAQFQVRGQEGARISFYDWQESGVGHTAVFTMSGDVPVNIVNLPDSLSL